MMARLTILALSFVVLMVMASASAVSSLAAKEDAQMSSWTIMVYMADDTTSSLNWQDDLNEMEAAQQNSETNIIVLADPYGPNNSLLYRVQHDSNFLDPAIVSGVVNDSGTVIIGGEANMALANTLRTFIEFSSSTYPADKYVLILWGHGAGWRGLCPDGTDLLTLPELGQGLAQATANMGRKLDLVVVDSCAEATIETLWQIHDWASFFVGSEKDVPFQGLPYTMILDHLTDNPNQSIEEFASEIVDDYVLWSGSNTDYSVTMGVFDLSKMEPLIDALDALSLQGAKYNPIFHETLRTTFNSSERYEDAFSVDFEHFMWQLQRADLPLEIRYYAFQSLLTSEAVVKHFAKYANTAPLDGVDVDNASGLTIHAPTSDLADAQYADILLASGFWFHFGGLLRGDTVPRANGPGPTVSYVSTQTPNDTAILTWPNGTESETIWTFRNQTGGLVLESVLNSFGTEVSLTGFSGRLTLATSSYRDGNLSSYKTVNITLDANSTIIVHVTDDDQLTSQLSEKYRIHLISPDGNELEPAELPPTATDDTCLFVVRVPEDAAVGDIVTIEVVDKATGDIVGTKRVFVPLETTTVNVGVASSCDCPYKILVPLLFALLPGLLILAFALSLHHQNKRKGPEEPT